MTSGDIDTLKGSIQQLLSGVKTAFITSLVGIGGAIAYSFVHHNLLKNLQANVKRLTDKLDENFPRRSIEDWLAEKFSEARQQTQSLQSIDEQAKEQTRDLKNIGEQVATAIYEGLDERINDAVDKFCVKLEEKILPQVDRICAAIEKLGNSSAKGLDETLAKIAGEQMKRFSDALDRFSDSIDEKLKAANEISKIMNEQLLDTLQRLADKLQHNADADTARRDEDYKKFSATLESLIEKLNYLVEKFKRHQETSAGNFEDVLRSLLEYLKTNAGSNAAQINEAVKAFREIVNRHNETTQKTFGQIQQLLADTESLLGIMNDASLTFKNAADPVEQSTLQLTRNLTETSAQMKTLATANQTTRENLAALSTRLATFVQNFNGIADQLERATATITDSLDNYNGKMSVGLTEALNKFGSNVNDAYSGLNEIVGDLTEALDDLNRKRG